MSNMTKEEIEGKLKEWGIELKTVERFVLFNPNTTYQEEGPRQNHIRLAEVDSLEEVADFLDQLQEDDQEAAKKWRCSRIKKMGNLHDEEDETEG